MLRPPEGRTLPVLGLVALVLILFRSVVFGGRSLYEWDIHLLWHTYAQVFVRTLAEGSWPLWNPWSSFGVPFLADANTQVLYPTTWLLVLVQPTTLHGPLVVAHLIFGAIGTYLLFRRLELSRGAALFGAACWTASGPLLSLVYVYNMLVAAAWLPWVLVAALCALEGPSLSRAVAWGAALAVQLFAGSPDLSLATGFLCAGLVVRHLWLAGTGARRGGVGVSLAALGAFLVLGAVQWAPSLALARASGRWGQGVAGAAQWSLHPLVVLEMLWPVALWRLPLADAWSATLFDGRLPFLHSHYLGLSAVVFAVIGATSAGPWRRPAAALLVLALLFATGTHTPIAALLVRLVPPLGLLRFPEKAVVLVAFAAAFLAGAGLDAVLAGRSRRVAVAAGLLAFASAGVVAASLAGRSFPWDGLLGAHVASAPLASPAAAVGLAGFGALVVALSLLLRRPPLAILGTLLTLVSLVTAQSELNPTAPRQLLTLRPAPLAALGPPENVRLWTFDYLEGDAAVRWLGRSDLLQIATVPRGWTAEQTAALATRNMLAPPSAAAYGIRGSYDADFSQVYPRPLAALVELMRGSEDGPLALRLLRMGGVTHAIAFHDLAPLGLELVATEPGLLPEPLRVYRVPGRLPRLRLVVGARVAAGTPQAAALVAAPDFDPAREVVLEGANAAAPASDARGEVRVVEDAPGRVRVDVTATEPAWLVHADTWDAGWSATLDGVSVPILRANVAFRAIRVPAGRHTIDERYRPAALRLGALVSALAWAGALVQALRKTPAVPAPEGAR